jgi:hypothetical protein
MIFKDLFFDFLVRNLLPAITCFLAKDRHGGTGKFSDFTMAFFTIASIFVKIVV